MYYVYFAHVFHTLSTINSYQMEVPGTKSYQLGI